MSNTTVPETISAPIVPAVRAIDLWLQVIPQSSVPMAFTSLSALVCAVLFGRWLAVVTPKRATEEQILKLLHQNQPNNRDETHFLVESMLEEKKHYFHQMAYIRWALVGASLSVFSFFFASFLQGVSVFQTPAPGATSVPLADAARAFTIIGAFLLAVGIIITCVELSEVLTPKIKIDRVRVEYEHQRTTIARASSPVPSRAATAKAAAYSSPTHGSKLKETEKSSSTSVENSSKSEEEMVASSGRDTDSSDSSKSS